MLINRWNKNGKALVKDGNGGWVSKNDDGTKKRKQMYEGGLLTVDLSFEQEYYENGQLKSEKSYQYGNPQMKKWKKIYEDGREAGKWTYKYTKYESGQIKSEVSYRNGIRDGSWIVWHENGRRKEQGLVRDGNETGDWTFWDEDGNITEIKKYDSN